MPLVANHQYFKNLLLEFKPIKDYFRASNKTESMNIHEYQAKEILKSYGVRIQEGIVAETPDQAVKAAMKPTEDTGTRWHVIKAQIHAGGRGKGGGVKLA